jgi:chromosome segregation ATPase
LENDLVIDALLPVVLVVSIVTLAIAIGTLRSSRRSEDLGEDRYELLRDQRDRLELLREERRMLIEELERESQERQQLMGALKGAGQQLGEGVEPALQENVETERRTVEQEQERRLRLERELRRLEEELEQERQARAETERRVEQLEQEGEERSRFEQQAERAAQDLQQLRGDLEREKERRLEAQRRAEQLEEERIRLERMLGRSKEEPSGGRSEARPWWRRPVLVVGLLFGALAAWFTSLVVALNLLSP